MDSKDAPVPLGHLLAHTSRLLLTLLHRNFRKAGYELSHEQWIVLLHLWQGSGKGISQQILGERTGKDKASITRLVQSLEDTGLVARKPHPTDARIRLVHATLKGKRLQQSVNVVLQETQQQVESGFTAQELEVTRSNLDRIRMNAELALGRKPIAGIDPFLDT